MQRLSRWWNRRARTGKQIRGAEFADIEDRYLMVIAAIEMRLETHRVVKSDEIHWIILNNTRSHEEANRMAEAVNAWSELRRQSDL